MRKYNLTARKVKNKSLTPARSSGSYMCTPWRTVLDPVYDVLNQHPLMLKLLFSTGSCSGFRQNLPRDFWRSSMDHSNSAMCFHILSWLVHDRKDSTNVVFMFLRWLSNRLLPSRLASSRLIKLMQLLNKLIDRGHGFLRNRFTGKHASHKILEPLCNAGFTKWNLVCRFLLSLFS